jgi:hypothetical protein
MFNALIIGVGSIGGMRDGDSNKPTSHCSALKLLQKAEKIDRIFIHDIDYKKMEACAKKWHVHPIYAIKDIIENGYKIDISIISVPTEYHYKTANLIIDTLKDLKVLVIEKPFCSNYRQAKRIIKRCKKLNIKIICNYTRQFNFDLRNLCDEISRGKYGYIQAIKLTYTRGFKRDACHGINFINNFAGKCLKIKKLSKNGIADYSKNDLTIPVFAEYEKCKNVFLMPCDGNKYSIFEMEILLEHQKIELVDHFREIKFYLPEKEKVYGNFYSIPSIAYDTISTDLENSLIIMYDNIVSHLKYGTELLYEGEQILETNKILDRV